MDNLWRLQNIIESKLPGYIHKLVLGNHYPRDIWDFFEHTGKIGALSFIFLTLLYKLGLLGEINDILSLGLMISITLLLLGWFMTSLDKPENILNRSIEQCLRKKNI